MPRMQITEHAVERFIQRWAPGMGLDEARFFLEEESQRATRLKTKTLLGQAQWQLADPRCILVTKRSSGDTSLVCVTILPEPDSFGAMTDDEREIIAEAAARVPPTITPPEAVRRSLPKPKTVSPPSPAQVAYETARKSERRSMHLAMMNLAAIKSREKTERHRITEDLTAAMMRRGMKAAVRYLVTRLAEGDERARPVIEAIQEVEPGYLTEAFIKAMRSEL